MSDSITVIGGGLAGCEAALKAASLGVPVILHEMKPAQYTPAHSSPLLGELVCSNSLRSADVASGVGLLKAEMSLLGSAMMRSARQSQVPAGKALAVDREKFAACLDAEVREHPLIELRQARVNEVPAFGVTILATGPLSSDGLAASLAGLTGSEGLHFYDAIAPIVSAESVDLNQAFWLDRYAESGGDYLNCPLSQEQYQVFYQALLDSPQVPLHEFESAKFFEGCLPIEVMAQRGPKTLLFGPMKPVGLIDPKTGRRPFAVVQLRKEDVDGRLLNLVGFQTKLTHGSQEKVFRLIPALAQAEFARLGSIHRNTFLDAPRVLTPDVRLVAAPHVFVAGQLSGVEGYVESAAMGILCGLNAARLVQGLGSLLPPPTTALGGLLTHLGNTQTKHFQPSNVNFGLLPSFKHRVSKKERKRLYALRALEDLVSWMESNSLPFCDKPPII